MPKFWKEEIRPGKYLVTAEDGSRKIEEFTRERLTAQAKTHNDMLAAGLLIPVPWSHENWDTPVPASEKKAVKTKHNAGFTEAARIDPTTGALEILHDIPLKEDAERIGKTVREVSPYIRKSWTDGTGKVWEDAILHSALVTNPIMPGQTNFRPAEDGLAIAMSHLIPEGFDLRSFGMSGDGATLQNGAVPPPTTLSSTNPNIDDVLVALKKVNLVLPSDTTFDTLGQAIIIASTAIAGANGDGGDDDTLKPGERTTQPPAGVALSHQESLTMSENKKLDAAIAAASEVKKKDYRQRITNLIGKVTTKAYADQHLFPQVESFAMSFNDDGTEIPSALNVVLESLEAAAADKKPGSAFKGNDGSALAHNERIAERPTYNDANNDGEDESVSAGRKQGEAARDKMLKQRGIAV